MYNENSIEPVSPIFTRRESTQFNQRSETFHDIFKRTLNHKSNSRPPKIELTGILIPIARSGNQVQCKFVLETDQNEYHLRMSDRVSTIAKKLDWEEVTVRGYLNPDESVLEVETISRSNRNEPYGPTLGLVDLYYELDQYKKSIARMGMLDTATDYLAS